jgi:ABC-type multidrug transport system fused ATPase/permease subunit
MNNIVIRTFRLFWPYLTSAQKKKFFVASFLLLVLSLLDVFGLASVIPVIISASDKNFVENSRFLNPVFIWSGLERVEYFIAFMALFVLLFFIFKNTVAVLINYYQVRLLSDITYNITEAQFEKFYGLDYHLFKSIPSHKAIHYIYQVPAQFNSGVLQPFLMLCSEISIALFIIVGILIYNPIIFLTTFLLLGVPIGLVYRMMKTKNQVWGWQIDDALPLTYASIATSVQGYADIKITNSKKYFQNTFLKKLRELLDLRNYVFTFSFFPPRFIETVAITGILALLLYAFLFSGNKAQAMAILGVFAVSAYRLMPSINRILGALMSMRKHEHCLTNLKLYEDSLLDTAIDSGTARSFTFDHQIVIQDLSYSYPGTNKKVLNNINLSIKKGQKIGLIGRSGSGKTTLINLILRFLKEEKGQIQVDGVIISPENTNQWRRMIGYVRQEIFIIDGTIKENILMGSDEGDIQKLNEAVRLASLSSFVESLPDGIDTHVGEGGGNLSGGQKQRLGIARALYQGAQLLLMDEATSALDNETEKEITEAIENLSGTNITMILIAHRITTLKSCDFIYEFQDGEIAREWNYLELIKEKLEIDQ